MWGQKDGEKPENEEAMDRHDGRIEKEVDEAKDMLECIAHQRRRILAEMEHLRGEIEYVRSALTRQRAERRG